MEPNLTAHYLGIVPDHARLSVQAERGWLVEQAVSTQPKRTPALAMRRWIGGVLIAAGQHLQGMQEAAVMPTDTAHAQ